MGTLNLSDLQLALFAAAEYLVAMMRDLKPNGFAHFLLCFFDARPLNLDDAVAIRADQMVMMGPITVNFVTDFSVGINDWFDQTAFRQHFERPEDRNFSDPFRFKGFSYVSFA